MDRLPFSRRDCLVALAGAVAGAARADDFPAKPVTLVVPTAAGGGSDIVARALAARLQVTLKQSVVVDNKPGANGNIGARVVLQEPADGYTLMLGHPGVLAINPHVYKNVPFDPLRDFAPVAWATSYSSLLVVSPELPVKTVAQFIAYTKERPDRVTYGTPGYGTSVHMAMEMLQLVAGIKLQHVPYKGMAPALTDLMGNQIGAAFVDTLTGLPFIRSGKLRAIGGSAASRIAPAPETPAIAETLPGFDVQGFNGVVVKAGAPADRIALLNRHLNEALKAPDVVKLMADNATEVRGGTPARFGELIQKEYTRWGDVARRANLAKE